MFHDQSDTFAKSLDRTPTPTRDQCIAKLKAARARMQTVAKRPPPLRPAEAVMVLPEAVPPRVASPNETAILTLAEGLPEPSVKQLIELVARAHRMPDQRLLAHCRERVVTRARKHLVHVIFRDKPKLSSTEIGRRIGGFDHSTILHARDTFAKNAPLIERQIREVDEALAKLRKDAN